MLLQIINALTGIQGSSETGNSASARWTGLIIVLASLLVAVGAKNGIALGQEEVVGQLTQVAEALGVIWYAFGALRASFNWAHDKVVTK
jgi:hypothetical protein